MELEYSRDEAANLPLLKVVAVVVMLLLLVVAAVVVLRRDNHVVVVVVVDDDDLVLPWSPKDLFFEVEEVPVVL